MSSRDGESTAEGTRQKCRHSLGRMTDRALCLGGVCIFLVVAWLVLDTLGVLEALHFGQLGALRRAEELEEEGRIPEAIRWADKAVSYAPTSLSYWSRGALHEENGDYARAIADYSVAIGLEPDRDFYFFRGRAYEKSGDSARAVYDYCRLLLLAKPSNLGLRGYAGLRVGNKSGDGLPEWLAFFERAAQQHPGDQEIGQCLEMLREACEEEQEQRSVRERLEAKRGQEEKEGEERSEGGIP